MKPLLSLLLLIVLSVAGQKTADVKMLKASKVGNTCVCEHYQKLAEKEYRKIEKTSRAVSVETMHTNARGLDQFKKAKIFHSNKRAAILISARRIQLKISKFQFSKKIDSCMRF